VENPPISDVVVPVHEGRVILRNIAFDLKE